MKKKDSFWFWLLIVVTACFWGLTWDTLPYLSPDDMGKDLYPFEMALKGEWPCRDYYWQYGPLMLFYYSFWLGIGGIHLLSIRMGYAVLYLLSSMISYRMLRPFVSPPIAFLASLSFLIQGMVYPYYNFNHIGAIPLLLMSLASLWKFFIDGQIRWVYLGGLALIGMALIKWNVGVVSFFAFFASLVLFKRIPKIRYGVFLCLIFAGVVLGVYALQYSGCRELWVRECLTLTTRNVAKIDLWLSFKHLVQWFLVWDRSRLWWLGLFLVFGILGFLGWKKRGWGGEERKRLLWVMGSLLLYGLFNSSDYFIWAYIYRIDFWSFPVLALAMAFAAEWAKSLFGRKLRIFFAGLIFVGVLALPLQVVREAFAARVPERYLDFARGKIYLVKETLSSIEAIKKGTQFILDHTTPDQEILILPKEPLYSFLSGRRHAVRELDFELINQLPEQEEEAWLRQMEAKQVPLVLLSNRDESNLLTNKGLLVGSIGKTHYPELGKYLFENYEEVQTWGIWETPRPRTFHAIKIFQRKD